MTHAIRKYLSDFIAIIVMIVAGVGIGIYILLSQDSRPTVPFFEEPPVPMQVEFTDAQAVVPGQGQSVRIAGVEVGKIAKVEIEDGLAVVTMNIQPQFVERVHQDATALLRPRTGLKDMFIELDPGSTDAPQMPENGTVDVQNSSPDVDPDEVLATLDTDTRAYLQLLVNGAGQGLQNRGNDLREVFKRLEPLHRDIKRVSGALATRRDQLARLVHNYAQLTAELANNDTDLERLVTASNKTFGALASQDANISRAVALLPGALRQSQVTLAKANQLGQVLGPTLNDLRPAVRELDEANEDLLPLARNGDHQIRNQLRPFVRVARPYVGNYVEPAARNLAKAAPELTTSILEINRFLNILAFNPAGAGQEHSTHPRSGAEHLTGDDVADRNRKEGYLFWLHWVATTGNSVFSTRDANGPYRRVLLQLSCDSIQGLFDEQAAVFKEAFPPVLADALTEATLTLIFGQDPLDALDSGLPGC
jgi:phospholipid/cholesterol/gamma-HCH transport system substrate-binding protein